MKKKTILFIVLIFCLKLFTIEVYVEQTKKGNFIEKEYETTTIVTTREKRGTVNTEVWQGVLLSDFIYQSGISEFEVIEFLADDKYLVRLSLEQIREFKPMVALSRNREKLNPNQYRLIGEDMPDMYWVANIEKITFLQKKDFLAPLRIYSYHWILDQLRLHYTPVRGFRFSDIFNILDRNAAGPVKLVSKDGMEQILPLSYFKNAYLQQDDDKYSLYSFDIPSGMWMKDIMIISINNKAIFFYDDIDKEENIKYREFIDLVSENDIYVTFPNMRKVTDWDEIDWGGITFVGVMVD